MAQEELLKVSDLHIYYGGICALHDINLHVNKGEIVSIIGANGAGKSTLLKSIAGDIDIKSGVVTFEGVKLPSKPYEVVRKRINLVPEGRQIFTNLTVKENLRIGAFLEKNKAKLDIMYEEVYSLFPRLKERIKQNSGTLSGGEQQMLAVGRALMAKPKLLMLDEPSLGLAPIVVNEMYENFLKINHDMGVTILLVEQNANIALEVATRAYILSLGEISMEGTGRELFRNPDVQKAYMGIK